jgi:hypothetical protein
MPISEVFVIGFGLVEPSASFQNEATKKSKCTTFKILASRCLGYFYLNIFVITELGNKFLKSFVT